MQKEIKKETRAWIRCSSCKHPMEIRIIVYGPEDLEWDVEKVVIAKPEKIAGVR